MPLYFDRAGNAFQIEDEATLKKKKKITVINEAGEEFEIAADKADEYKLTPDESRRIFVDMQDRVAKLGKVLGMCPVIDPVPFENIRDHVATHRAAPRFRGGCPMIDPVGIESVHGSLVAAGLNRLEPSVIAALRKVLEACPNIDPPRLGAVLGSVVHRAADAGVAGRFADAGCPVIDPPDIGTVGGIRPVGTATLSPEIVGLLGGLLEACPNIDPPRLGTVLGTLVEREIGRTPR